MKWPLKPVDLLIPLEEDIPSVLTEGPDICHWQTSVLLTIDEWLEKKSNKMTDEALTEVNFRPSM